MPDTQYFTNIDGKYVKDAEARGQLADLEDYVETLDFHTHVGTDNPSASLGENGDYYYKRTDEYTALDYSGMTEMRSSNEWIGFDFTVSHPISIEKMYVDLIDSTTVRYRIATSSEILYDSQDTQGTSGLNSVTLSTPLQLTPNTTYTAYVVLGGNYGQYMYQPDMQSRAGKNLTFVQGRYGEGTNIPANADTRDTYYVNFDYKTADEYVIAEYHKKSGTWVQI